MLVGELRRASHTSNGTCYVHNLMGHAARFKQPYENVSAQALLPAVSDFRLLLPCTFRLLRDADP